MSSSAASSSAACSADEDAAYDAACVRLADVAERESTIQALIHEKQRWLRDEKESRKKFGANFTGGRPSKTLLENRRAVEAELSHLQQGLLPDESKPAPP